MMTWLSSMNAGRPRHAALFAATASVLLGFAVPALAHGVAEGDKGFIQQSSGPLVVPFV
jgi:hypothetical protein